MTNQEFSNEFDVLYNNLTSNLAPGLNEYEKSVILTLAQEELLKNYFNPLGNKYGEGFDDSAKRQIDFSELVVTASTSNSSITSVVGSPLSFDKRARLYLLPEDVLLLLNEAVDTTRGGITSTKQLIPIHFEEYTRLMSKPYKEPLKNHAWRLVSKGANSSTITTEIIPRSGDTVSLYSIRYVRRPRPIILVDLDSEYGGLSINGVTTESECELNPIIHREILTRAVELAKNAYYGDLNSTVELGKRSE